MSEHHGHDPMKGHHHPEARGHRWWHRFALRTRSDAADHVERSSGTVYPGVFSYVSGHRDAPLTPLARLLWWLAGFAIVAGGITLIALWMR